MKVLVVALAVAVAAPSAHAETSERYVVQRGDTCLGIAIRVIGERAAVRELHRLNPQLGSLPHHLEPGSILVLPPHAPSGPDARLTRAHGDVKIRKPSTTTWNAAERGMDLFRAYRVGAATNASAELTFADHARLGMRERTIVVIYGPEKRMAKLISAIADLERGTLETRLGELDGKPLVVRTPAAEADLRAGDVVIGTADGGPSVVSNHKGAPIELRGRTKRRSAVKVAAGMGSRVVPGRAPEPPRPLPATPTWTTASGLRIPGPIGTTAVAWSPVDRAARYRVAIRSAGGDVIAAMNVDAPLAAIELPLPPGTYHLTVAAFDRDGLESVPSAVLDIAVVALQFVAPNGRSPGTGATTPRVVTAGTTIIAPDGFVCTTGAAPSPRLVLEHPGRVEVRCAGAAGQSNPIELEVAAAEQPAIRGATLAHVAASTPSPRPRWNTEVGFFGGYHSVAVREPLRLEDTTDSMRVLEDGPTAGVRAAMHRRRFGAELELAVSSLGRPSGDDSTAIAASRLHALFQHREGGAVLRLLAGAGVSFAPAGVAATFSYGGAAGLRVHGIEVRADLRHELGAGVTSGLAHGLQATLGVSIDLAP